MIVLSKTRIEIPPRGLSKIIGHHRPTAAAVVHTPTAWDPAHCDAHVVFASSNLNVQTDATAGIIVSSGRAVLPILNGEHKFFSVHTNVSPGGQLGAVGLVNATWAFPENQGLGADGNSIGTDDGGGGTITYGGANVGSAGFWSGGGVDIDVAVIGHSKCWMRASGGLWLGGAIGVQDPANNIGGIDISAMGDVYPAYQISRFYGALGDYTGNFGATAYPYAAPSGFSNITS